LSAWFLPSAASACPFSRCRPGACCRRQRGPALAHETLTTKPEEALAAVYEFIGEKPFKHDFSNIEFDENDWSWLDHARNPYKVEAASLSLAFLSVAQLRQMRSKKSLPEQSVKQPGGSRRRPFSSVTRQLSATSFPIGRSRQVSQHGLAGFFGLSKRFKGRAGHPDGACILRERAPRCHIAGRSVKAATAPALVTDHEGKAVVARVPYFHVLDGTNDAGELHSHSTAVAILDADRARAAPIVIPPSQNKRLKLGGAGAVREPVMPNATRTMELR
jgi:hypothetical protein